MGQGVKRRLGGTGCQEGGEGGQGAKRRLGGTGR